MELFTVVFVLTIIIIIITFLSSYFKDLYNAYNLSKQFVGPKAYPLIGNAHLFFNNMEDTTNTLLDMYDKYSSENIPLRFWLGLKLSVFIYQADCIKKILNHSGAYEKSYMYEFSKPITGNGLFSAPGITWGKHRKILESVFKSSLIRSYEVIIVKNGITLIRTLNNFNGKEVDVMHHVHLCTLDIIYSALLETDLNLQNDPNNDLAGSISCAMELGMQRVFKLWQHPNIIFYNTSDGKNFKKCLSSIDNITREIIELKKKNLTEDQLTGTSTFGSEGRTKNRFLDLIFSKEAKYSEENIRDEINTIAIAGSDTTAFTISFVFLMLASHPEIQSKVYEELYHIYGSTDPEDNPVQYKDIKNIGILDRVIKETLRLFPPAPLVARETKQDIKVREDIIIPKNCNVVVGIFTIHRSKHYWNNPLKFDPDRFLPGNYDPGCFVPFSSGIRNCIGRTFAIVEMKILVAIVLRKFVIQIDNPQKVQDINLKLAATSKPTKPIILRFKNR